MFQRPNFGFHVNTAFLVLISGPSRYFSMLITNLLLLLSIFNKFFCTRKLDVSKVNFSFLGKNRTFGANFGPQ